jgi:hypothetical protein
MAKSPLQDEAGIVAPRRLLGRSLRAVLANRFPIFHAAVFLALATIFAIVVWSVIDASFLLALQLAQIDLGWLDPGMHLETYYRWESLGARLALLRAMVLTGIIATVAALFCCFIGRGPGRTLRGWLIATSVIVCWLALVAGWERLEAYGVAYRRRRELPLFERAAAKEIKLALELPFPAPTGTVSWADRRTDADDADIENSSEGSAYSMLEWYNAPFSWLADGSIIFDCLRRSPRGEIVCLQFRPRDDVPCDWNSKRSFARNSQIRARMKLQKNWFLVWYWPSDD